MEEIHSCIVVDALQTELIDRVQQFKLAMGAKPAQRIALEGHHLDVESWTFRTGVSKVSRSSQLGQKDGGAETLGCVGS